MSLEKCSICGQILVRDSDGSCISCNALEKDARSILLHHVRDGRRDIEKIMAVLPDRLKCQKEIVQRAWDSLARYMKD